MTKTLDDLMTWLRFEYARDADFIFFGILFNRTIQILRNERMSYDVLYYEDFKAVCSEPFKKLTFYNEEDETYDYDSYRNDVCEGFGSISVQYTLLTQRYPNIEALFINVNTILNDALYSESNRSVYIQRIIQDLNLDDLYTLSYTPTDNNDPLMAQIKHFLRATGKLSKTNKHSS